MAKDNIKPRPVYSATDELARLGAKFRQYTDSDLPPSFVLGSTTVDFVGAMDASSEAILNISGTTVISDCPTENGTLRIIKINEDRVIIQMDDNFSERWLAGYYRGDFRPWTKVSRGWTQIGSDVIIAPATSITVAVPRPSDANASLGYTEFKYVVSNINQAGISVRIGNALEVERFTGHILKGGIASIPANPPVLTAFDEFRIYLGTARLNNTSTSNYRIQLYGR